jgi:hypothetical protein
MRERKMVIQFPVADEEGENAGRDKMLLVNHVF